jgi:hypothetical protein
VGQINILLRAEPANIKQAFNEVKQKCEKFYGVMKPAPKQEILDSLEIRGRLDFLESEQADTIESKMHEYAVKVESGEIEGCYVDSKAEITIACRSEPISQASIRVAMYGQFTMINHQLILDMMEGLGGILPHAKKTMLTYDSFSALIRGSDCYILNPFFNIKGLSYDRKNLLPMKDNLEECFKFGDMKK